MSTTPDEVIEGIKKVVEDNTRGLREKMVKEMARLFCDRQEELLRVVGQLKEALSQRETGTRAAAERAARLERELTQERRDAVKLKRFAENRRQMEVARGCLRALWWAVGNARRMRRAEKEASKTLARRVVRAWLRVCSADRRERIESKWQGKAEEVASKMSWQYETELAALRSRLEDAERRATAASQERIVMQEDLRKALMRGVCALNHEAMAAINFTSSSSSVPPQQAGVSSTTVQSSAPSTPLSVRATQPTVRH